MSVIREVGASVSLNIKSIPQRAWTSASSAVAIALVTFVLLGFLSMANGFRQTVAGTGSAAIALLLQEGATNESGSIVGRDQVRLVEEAPGIVRKNGHSAISPEVYIVVDSELRGNRGKANLSLRGMDVVGVQLRDDIGLVSGRMFRPGTNEIVVGRSAAAEFAGFDVGRAVQLGPITWRVVGVFDSGGNVASSEVWADARVVQNVANRGSAVQSIRVRLENPSRLVALRQFLKSDPRLGLEVMQESEYFASQAGRTNDFIQRLGWPLAICMAIGAAAGALNAMYSSVALRSRELATLRAMGFGRVATFTGIVIEALIISLVGGGLGVFFAWVFLDGLTGSTLGQDFAQVFFEFRLDATLVAQALMLAVGVGLIGGMLPALRAVRQPIVAGLVA